MPLAELLKTIETHFDIHFTYLDQAIEGKTVYLPDIDNTPLEKVLNDLSAQTNLDFINIDQKSIVISIRSNPFSDLIVQRLEEVVILNYLTQGISKKNDGKISIENDKFGILPGLTEPDVLQSIQALPGVLSADETASNINVRGGTPDQNLMLWDGIRMYQSGHFFGLVSAYNPYLTNKVDVSKNGTSAKYGDGVSSVIDIQQPNALDQDFKAGAGFNLLSAGGFSKIPISKKTELQVAARRSITDLVYTPTYDQYRKRSFEDSDLISGQSNNSYSGNETFYFYDVSAKLLYDATPSDQFRVNLASINNKLEYDESLINGATVETLNSNLAQKNLAAGIQYLKYWSRTITTTAQVYLSDYSLDATNVNLLDGFILDQQNKVKDMGLKLNITNHIDSNLKLHSGYQFNEVSVINSEALANLTYTNYNRHIGRNHAIYGEAEFTSENQNTYARIGLRINYMNKLGEIFTEPRIAVSHKFDNTFRLEFLAELKSQTISQNIGLQHDFLGIENKRWVLSDGDLVPIIESKQASIGIYYDKNKLLLGAETFIKDVRGITSGGQGFRNQYQFVDAVGSYQTKGIDLLANRQFGKFGSWVSYSYSVNDYRFETLNNG
ncbi:MAG TPA: TonB-dependent receptor plug domain-containing protein, partial [Aquaticitalea sp.]|nr:TonB-dependent receptor plug domain-containing protein [Aquaticitalea sp.]